MPGSMMTVSRDLDSPLDIGKATPGTRPPSMRNGSLGVSYQDGPRLLLGRFGPLVRLNLLK
jgi:hypothetical protein